MKVLSIIGIVLFTLTFLMIFGLVPEDPDSAAILGLLSMLYAIPFSIIALVVSSRRKKQPVNVHEQLLQLGELKEKNIISEYEFDQKKEKLLSKIKYLRKQLHTKIMEAHLRYSYRERPPLLIISPLIK